jgi:hypothetical protein
MTRLIIITFLVPIVIMTFSNVAHVNDIVDSTMLKRGDLIEKKIDLNAERRLQEEVDKGHQPWRLIPLDVAYSEVADDPNVTYNKCKALKQTPSMADVECKGTQVYFIHLKRLLKPNGIWTVLSVRRKGVIVNGH